MTNFAYEIDERLRRTAELRTSDNSWWIGFCVEKAISIIVFLAFITVLFCLDIVGFFQNQGLHVKSPFTHLQNSLELCKSLTEVSR